MSDAVLAAVITGLLSLCGVIVSNLASARRTESKIEAAFETAQAVTDTKVEELTREVRAHNNFAQRVPVLEEKIKVANHRLDDLERKDDTNE